MTRENPDLRDPNVQWPYAPTPRSEAALERLVHALRSEATRIAFVGPAAAGKTTVLHELPRRLGRSFACAHLPQPWLGPDEIRAWIESFAGPVPADSGKSLEDLAYATARRGAGLVLLIDDANAMPLEVARALDALVERTDRALRLLLTGLDDERLERVLVCFDAPFEKITLAPPNEEPTMEAAPYEPLPRIGTARPAIEPLHPTHRAEPGGEIDAVRANSARALPASLLPERRPRIASVAAALATLAVVFAIGRWSATPHTEFVAAPLPAQSSTLPAVDAAPVAPPAPAETSRSVSPEPVLVHVNARPWARVSVDGQEIGITPLGNVPLEPGLRRFRAELPDGRVVERDVAIDAGNRRVTFP